jgi:glycosyltransferase involved in cell wall biosynthesis
MTNRGFEPERMIPGLVSVIVPAYQAEAFLDEALESALGQDYEPIEVIVVDDGSTDRTAEVAARHEVQLLRRAHGGPAPARNSGLAAARGEFITILDADDVWPADRISKQVEFLTAHPEAGLVVGLTEYFLTPGEPCPPHFPRYLDGPVAGHMPAMLARRSVFEAIGVYNESLVPIGEDVEWFLRARDAGVSVAKLDHVVLRYRIHASNTSRDNDANRAMMLRLLRASVARRRGTE